DSLAGGWMADATTTVTKRTTLPLPLERRARLVQALVRLRSKVKARSTFGSPKRERLIKRERLTYLPPRMRLIVHRTLNEVSCDVNRPLAERADIVRLVGSNPPDVR